MVKNMDDNIIEIQKNPHALPKTFGAGGFYPLRP
jgi:hypothetical protein